MKILNFAYHSYSMLKSSVKNPPPKPQIHIFKHCFLTLNHPSLLTLTLILRCLDKQDHGCMVISEHQTPFCSSFTGHIKSATNLANSTPKIYFLRHPFLQSPHHYFFSLRSHYFSWIINIPYPYIWSSHNILQTSSRCSYLPQIWYIWINIL